MKQFSYFRTSGFIPENQIRTESGDIIDLRTIPPFLRTLMVTDGTVTKALEAWFWERINVEGLSNNLEYLESEVEGLTLNKGDHVLKREVFLRGEESKRIYAFARSIVSLKHLGNEISQLLINGEIGIGELLREKDVETYRDIFKIDYLSSIKNDDSPLSIFPRKVISRSYRIRVNGIPSILVNEYFPIDLYEK